MDRGAPFNPLSVSVDTSHQLHTDLEDWEATPVHLDAWHYPVRKFDTNWMWSVVINVEQWWSMWSSGDQCGAVVINVVQWWSMWSSGDQFHLWHRKSVVTILITSLQIACMFVHTTRAGGGGGAGDCWSGCSCHS